MSREIDLTKPLSDEDRLYLVQRDKWRLLAQADGHDDLNRARREASEKFFSRTGPAPQPATPVAGDLPQGGAEAPQGDEEKPYEEWSYPELQEELKVRRQEALDNGMDEAEAKELYKAGGSAADLVQRLKDDDERNPQ
jgi:hypothetical protein